MAETLLELPTISDQQAFNLKRWEELCADPELAALDHRIETDRFGHIIMTPPAAFNHSDSQGMILHALNRLIDTPGKSLPECPISTSDGVKAADVVWISHERLADAKKGKLLVVAPEICVEVLSPSNTREEIDDKKRLYFEAGADEVWICDLTGRLLFFLKTAPDVAGTSQLCSNFPKSI